MSFLRNLELLIRFYALALQPAAPLARQLRIRSPIAPVNGCEATSLGPGEKSKGARQQGVDFRS